jgi:hypothetical protein
MSDLIKRHPLPAFFVLAYAFSWWPVPLGAFLPPGPLFAALVVTAVVDGRSGLRALRNRLLRWRVGWRWYAIALGLPLAVVLGATTVNVGFGAPDLPRVAMRRRARRRAALAPLLDSAV